MVMNVKDTAAIRDDVKDLDLGNSFDHWLYLVNRKMYIASNETGSFKGNADVYDDSVKSKKKLGADDVVLEGNRTVAFGFNMGSDKAGDKRIEGARAEWDAAFADVEKEEKPSFDDVRSGKTSMTDIQMDTLFAHSANIREKELEKHFGKDNWARLTPNEKLALLDVKYTSGSALSNSAHLSKDMKEVGVARGEKDYAPDDKELDNALWETKNHSIGDRTLNKSVAYGLTQRRLSETEMLNTHGSDYNKLTIPDHYEGKEKEAAQKISDKIAEVVKKREAEDEAKRLAKHPHGKHGHHQGPGKRAENEVDGLAKKTEFAGQIDNMIADWKKGAVKVDDLAANSVNGAQQVQQAGLPAQQLASALQKSAENIRA